MDKTKEEVVGSILFKKNVQSLQNKIGWEFSDFSVETLNSMTNAIYKVKAKTDCSDSDAIIIKIFKSSIPEFTDNNLENSIVSSLSERGLYPEIYLCDEEIRIEQFLMGQAPIAHEVNEELISEIGRKIGQFSCIFHDKKHEPKYELKKLFAIHDGIIEESKKIHQPSYTKCKELINELTSTAIRTNLLKMVPEQMVMSHNDTHFGNILVEDKTERVVLLDYEFSGDNYRGYDIGNFLNECTASYTGEFFIDDNRELKPHLQEQLIKTYYKSIAPTLPLERAQFEVEVGRMISHYFWFFIGVKQINDLPSLNMQLYLQVRYQKFMERYRALCCS